MKYNEATTNEERIAIIKKFHQGLQDLAEEFGLTYEPSKARYDSNGFEMQCDFAIKRIDDVVMDTAVRFWIFKAQSKLRLSKDRAEYLLGKEFMCNDKLYKLLGWKKNASKYPIICECIETKERHVFHINSFSKFEFFCD